MRRAIGDGSARSESGPLVGPTGPHRRSPGDTPSGTVIVETAICRVFVARRRLEQQFTRERSLLRTQPRPSFERLHRYFLRRGSCLALGGRRGPRRSVLNRTRAPTAAAAPDHWRSPAPPRPSSRAAARDRACRVAASAERPSPVARCCPGRGVALPPVPRAAGRRSHPASTGRTGASARRPAAPPARRSRACRSRFRWAVQWPRHGGPQGRSRRGFAVPSARPSRMFRGETSQCTKPSSCRYASASQICEST